MTGTRKKLTVRDVKLVNKGDSVLGVFQEIKEAEHVEAATGLVKLQPNVYLVDRQTGERLKVFGNAGLKTAIMDSGVTKGDMIEIVKLEKKQLQGGKTKNQYDIFQITE